MKVNVNLYLRRFVGKSLKRLAILALATFWLSGNSLGFGAASTADIPPSVSSRTSKSRARKVAPTRRTTHHARRRVRGPWYLSSYGDPSAEDNPIGDDPLVRQAALEALGKLSGSIVVVDPNSGRILTIVNQKLALTSGFTPCSTFKPIVALAALREGIITPTTKLYVGQKGRMNLTDALAHSNNPYFHKLGEMLGFKRITEYAREFGLGEKAGLDIPGESAGRYPSAPPKAGGVGFLAYCGTDVEVTPLQMAAFISAIFNGGTLYSLQYPRNLDEIASFQPVVRRRLDNLTEYIPEIHDGLAGSVLYGTGRSAFDPDLPIYGKTGTCSENGARLGWFVSYGGDTQSQYVAVVLLRGGQMMYGPHAAEIAGRFYRDLMLKERPTQARGAMPPSTSSGR
ncbi:MAG: penicillin-binding transpeptidase domain-containing protein [Terriglobia bacterium]